MKHIKYWIESGSHATVGDATVEETRRGIKEGLQEVEDCCGLSFEEVSRSSRARLDFYFKDNKQMSYNLGLGSTNGRIWLNNERDISGAYYRHVIQGLTIHEFEHTERIEHSEDRTSIMHPDLPVYHMSPNNVRFLQYKFGEPSKQFHPSARRWAGKAVRAKQSLITSLWIDWTILTEKRKDIIAARDWYPNHPLQDEILAIAGPGGRLGKEYKNLSRLSAEWRAENARWIPNTNAIQL